MAYCPRREKRVGPRTQVNVDLAVANIQWFVDGVLVDTNDSGRGVVVLNIKYV